MTIQMSRLLLGDFEEPDRHVFVAFQMDPRYLRLYDFPASDVQRAHKRFDLFLQWQRQEPRLNLQLGFFDGKAGQLSRWFGA